ncbi:MAG: helix-turn-helix domain-containing protein [Planctomycetota bacterium]
MQNAPQIVSLDELARRLRLSRRWLHREAMADRIPSLKAGHHRRFNVEAVAAALAKRAAGDTEGGAA